MEYEEMFNELNKHLDIYNLELCIIRKRRERKPPDFETKYQMMYGKTRVKEYREKAGLTMRQLATAMGVDRNIVLRVEDEKKHHRGVSIQKFADYFGVPFEEMLATDDQPDETE